jgi:thiosulfate/3-mercaptopyruvate sulfurtransferase
MTRTSPLVTTDWLADHLDDDDVVVLEVSSEEARSAGDHIPGTRHVFWKDLCWHDTDRDFPSSAVMAQRLAALGVTDDSTIAIVGDPVQFGTYAYWVLAMTGHDANAVFVDGGRERWLTEGRALGDEIIRPASTGLSIPEPDPSVRIGRDLLRDRLGDDKLLLLDARSPEEYAGERVSPTWFEIDYGAERKGRIPGAEHLYYQEILNEDSTLLDPAQLAARFGEFPIDDSDVVLYCRLSHRATLMWFALTRVLNHDDVRVYDGSWTEWGTIVGFPIER